MLRWGWVIAMVSVSGYRLWVRRVRVQPHVRRFLGERVDVWMGGVWWMGWQLTSRLSPMRWRAASCRDGTWSRAPCGTWRGVSASARGESWMDLPDEVEVLATILVVLETSVTQS